MNSYESELRRLKENFKNDLQYLKLTFGIYNILTTFVSEKDRVSLHFHSNYSSIFINSEDPFHIELEIIPKISEFFTGSKWTKTPSEKGFIYSFTAILGNTSERVIVSIFIYLNLTNLDSCTITQVPTGKTVKICKYVETPEYKTIVDCGYQ